MAASERIGKYEILDEIGRGGFAVVYSARDTELDRIVALKVLHPQLTTDPKFIQHFHQEARTAAGLRHPHIVTIHDVGEEAGQHYLAMTFLPGRTLDKWLTEGPLPVEQAVSIVEQIAGALDAIHEQRLVHRDVKPDNIILDEAGQATLLDFGIVRAAEGTRLMTTMAVLGTPEYMAPEQAELDGAAEIDWRADVYALGVVAYQMLVGQPPFTGKSPMAILHKHIYEPPPMPTALNPDLPAGLEPVLLTALAKGREKRFQQAGAFAVELRSVLLNESQIRQRETQLTLLYEQLQAAAAREDWAEVLALDEQIRALNASYRDVPQLTAHARKRLRHLQQKPMPTWAWIMGGAVVLMLLVGLSSWALSWWPPLRPTSTPPFTATPAGSPTSTPTGTPTPIPTLTSTPTGTPTPLPTGTSTSTPTATPTDTPTPTATSTPRPVTPTLVAPSRGKEFKNPIEFRWSGSLYAGQSYQVTARHTGSGDVVQSQPLTSQTWTTDLPAKNYGEWRWTVSVMHGERTVAISSEWMFWFSQFGGNGGTGDDHPTSPPPPPPKPEGRM